MNPWGDLSHIIFWSAYAFVLILMVIHVLAYALPAPGVWLGVLGFGLMWALPLNASASLITWCVWALWLIAILSLIPTPIRSAIIGGPVFRLFRKVLPSVSQTEQEALDAGTVWWEGELFSGRPNWSTLLAYPKPSLSVDEQAFLAGPVNELCEMLNDWKISFEMHDLPPMVWAYIKSQGFLGIIIPRQYGGLGFSAIAHSEIVMRLSTRCGAAAVTVMVPNSLGPAELLLHYGTTAQKNYYLPRLANGSEVPCFALTSPLAGSDAASISDFGIVCHGQYDGQEVIGLKITWNKRYITLAPIATILGLAFKLYDPEKILSDEIDRGITCALIPTHLPGISIGRRHFPLNVPFQNGPTQGDEVFVPLSTIIGGPEMIGQGWHMLMECLSAGRAISLPSSAIGQSKMAAHASGAYARIRRQFNCAIGVFEGIEEPLALIGSTVYCLDGARMLSLSAIDRGEKPAIVSAIMKYQSTEMGRHAMCAAMDIHGGKGICLGPNNYLGRFYQGAPIAITVEGANILTRSLIIFGQGAIRCHPFALKELTAAQLTDQKQALKDFDQALFGHVGYSLSNIVRSFWLSLTDGILLLTPTHGHARRYLQRIGRLSANFALMSDMAMLTMGAALKRKESLSARFADLMSDLSVAAGAVKRFVSDGQPEEDLPLLDYTCQQLLHNAQSSLDGLLRGFSNRPVAWFLRICVMPRVWWLTYHKPSDQLRHKIATLLINLSPARDRLIQGIDLSAHENNPNYLLSITLQAVLKIEAVEKRLLQAIHAGHVQGYQLAEQVADAVKQGVITAVEAQDYQEMHALRMRVINVDDFETL